MNMSESEQIDTVIEVENMLKQIDTVIDITTVLFALLGAFLIYHLLTRNETLMEYMGTDYHHLRAALHFFNYELLYMNPAKSKKILGPILDYLAYVCQFWYIPAVQGSHLRRNVLKAPIFAFTREGTCEEQLKKHFLDAAKKFDESRGVVRALGLFEFGLLLLIILAGITLSGVWIKLVYEPYILNSSLVWLFFGFYAALVFVFVLFVAFIYDLKRLSAFFMLPHVYDLLKWLFVRCLLFVGRDKSQDVKQYLEKAKIAYEDYIDFDYIKNETRKESLEKAEQVAQQFLEKRRSMDKDKDWEKEVEWTVPRAATEVLRRRFKYEYAGFIVILSGLLICAGLLLPFLSLSLPWIVILWVLVNFLILAVSVKLFLIFFRERGRKTISFLEDLHNCWDTIVEQERDTRTKQKTYKEVEKEIKKCKDA